MKNQKFIQGQSAIAIAIHKKFSTEIGIQVNRQRIGQWQRGEFLPDGIEPFPNPNAANRYDVKKSFAWIAKYIAAKKSRPSKTIAELEAKAEADARRARAKANREERDDRREAGELIERSVAENDAIGIVQRLHNACTVQDEQEIPNFVANEAKQLGATVEFVSALSSRLIMKMQSITTRRVEMFRTATEEFMKEQ